MPIDIAALPPEGRLMFLPVVIGADDGRYRYDRLDFDACEFDHRRYVFRTDRRGIDIDRWRKALPMIENYLGGAFRIVPRDGASLILERLPDIPSIYQLQPDMLNTGSIFLGLDVETAAQVRTPLNDLSHTLVAGASGAGKSSLMHQAMASVLTNIDAFEAVYLVDLKFGLEAALYASLSGKITVVAKHDDLPPLLDRSLATLEQRAAVLAAARETKWRGPQILIVIDEFADVLLGAKRQVKEELETKLVRLANLSRAFGIRFWVQTQHVDASTVPMPFRRNMATLISFRMPSNQLAAMFFGAAEDLPADITRLRPGQFIHRDGLNSHTTAIQGAFVTFADVERMMRPMDSEASASASL